MLLKITKFRIQAKYIKLGIIPTSDFNASQLSSASNERHTSRYLDTYKFILFKAPKSKRRVCLKL